MITKMHNLFVMGYHFYYIYRSLSRYLIKIKILYQFMTRYVYIIYVTNNKMIVDKLKT